MSTKIPKIGAYLLFTALSLHLGAVQSEEKEQEDARVNEQIINKQQEERLLEQKRIDEQLQQRKTEDRIQQRKLDDARWERSHGR